MVKLVKSININELDDYLEFVKLHRDLKVRLKLLLKMDELKLKQLQDIKNVSMALKIYKEKLHLTSADLDEEVKNAIKKYAKWGLYVQKNKIKKR